MSTTTDLNGKTKTQEEIAADALVNFIKLVAHQCGEEHPELYESCAVQLSNVQILARPKKTQ